MWFDDSQYVPKSFTWGKQFLSRALNRPDGVYRYHCWALHGVYYGYPLCCVKQSVDGIVMARLAGMREGTTPRSPEPFDRSGYVPCEACAAKPAEELLTQIANLRHCPTPFPMDLRDAVNREVPEPSTKELVTLLKRRVNHQSDFSIDDFRVKVGERLPLPGDPA